ncbi:hypothetical protein D3C87_1202600 [compost metagenome]
MGFLGFDWPAVGCTAVQYPVQLGTSVENCDQRGVIFGEDYDKDDAPQTIQKQRTVEFFVGASLLAMVVNDYACFLVKRSAL